MPWSPSSSLAKRSSLEHLVQLAAPAREHRDAVLLPGLHRDEDVLPRLGLLAEVVEHPLQGVRVGPERVRLVLGDELGREQPAHASPQPPLELEVDLDLLVDRLHGNRSFQETPHQSMASSA